MFGTRAQKLGIKAIRDKINLLTLFQYLYNNKNVQVQSRIRPGNSINKSQYTYKKIKI